MSLTNARQTKLRASLAVAVMLLTACGGGAESEELQPAFESRLSNAMLARGSGSPAVHFVQPIDGAIVKSPFEVTVETSDLKLAPAGFSSDGEGHFHVRVNNGCLDAGVVLPKDEGTIHVGTGASAVTVDLPPGSYELCVQIGDGFHVAVNVTDSISILVVE